MRKSRKAKKKNTLRLRKIRNKQRINNKIDESIFGLEIDLFLT